MRQDVRDCSMCRHLCASGGFAAWVLLLFPGVSVTDDVESPRGPVSIIGKVVDEAGNPAAGIAVRMEAGWERPTTVTDAEGAFRFQWSRPGEIFAQFIASNRDGTRTGVWRLDRRTSDACRIVLKPAREVALSVTDGSGSAIEGARVLVVGENASQLSTGATDANGRLAVRVPADAVVRQVAAFKPGMGFDYFTTLPVKQSPERKPLPEEIALKLMGARTARVKVVDGARRPVAGVMLIPWYVNQKGKAENMNLSGCSEVVGQVTDEAGVAVFDWLPREFVQGVPFLCRSSEYHALDLPSLKEDAAGDEVTLSLLRMSTLSGRVTLPDGRPAANIAIYADGAGKAFHNGHGMQFTAADGSYQMSVNSEEGYIVSVRDQRWAAPFHAGVVVREGQAVSGIDFVLSEGTILRGLVLSGIDQRPVPKSFVTVSMNVIRSPAEESKDKDRLFGATRQYQAALSDDEGRFRFCLGPGTYDLGGTKLVIENQRAIEQDLILPRSETLLLLQGNVVDREGQPVGAATVSGVYKAQFGRGDIETTTAPDGTFRVERAAAPAVLFVRSADGKLAGSTILGSEQTNVTLSLGHVVSARGRSLDENNRSLPMAKVSWGVKVYLGDTNKVPFRWCIGGSTITAADGSYEISGLMPGATYEVTYYHESENRYSTLKSFTPERLTLVELGDTRLRPQPKPYRPPTVEEKTAEFFKKRGSLAERISQAQDEARRCYLRVLLVLGDPAAAASRKIIEVRDKDWSRDTMDNFEQIGVSTADAEAVATLKLQFGEAIADLRTPALVVLDEQSKVLASTTLSLVGADIASAAAAGKEFLDKNALPQLDAEQLLADALQRARREDKRVFLQETATWCGPCRLLARYIDRQKSIFERHFVYVKIDRNRFAHGEQVMKRLRTKNGGIPWVLLLDAQANPLGCSEDEAGENYGFPTEPEEIKHFLDLLAKAAPGLKSEQLEVLRTDLESKP